jgi:hypothetical protein
MKTNKVATKIIRIRRRTRRRERVEGKGKRTKLRFCGFADKVAFSYINFDRKFSFSFVLYLYMCI